ncbi:L-threonylcarbamoyladenylate synthase [Coxiella burnetii]|uniref:L-threonylcarbamoyladenylate synthase n=1 Tax=Coxiella burnetii TaxID=777 RepID=UPI000183D168|nr:L-threonylcarbamoyladenylate synthase [Coxiella burnetii]ACJ18435.1 Sua5/YciO/YrdC/YwlC family protein [Coxiella burnetii CbuG_Q212]ATN66814.1 threonylcarbamoyl-AMP synthase [Coxiella burnetii]OYK86139.1 threonylcarbamoyl-AMP synthase [Coxiella burnetii]
MATIHIHPDNPQARLIKQAVETVKTGGILAYSTDSGYALGCGLGNKSGAERIRRLRQLNKAHPFTLLCRDLSEIAVYARIANPVFRFLKAHTPGPYTFILSATQAVPRQLQHPKRKTIGIRVPDHRVIQAILEQLQEPLMNVTLIFPGEQWAPSEISEREDELAAQVDLIVDSGVCGVEPTTLIDLVDGEPTILREGKGDISEI